ncbi:MAG: type II and III secretion system protein family protein [Pseudomonadota bacterium]
MRKISNTGTPFSFAVMLLCMFGITPVAGAQVMLDESMEKQVVAVAKNQSEIIHVSQPVEKISVGNPDVADILILRSRQLYVVGKKLGSTNVTLWDNSNRVIHSVNIEVTHDLEGLKAKLHQLMPGENIEVRSSQGAIVLSGEVSSASRVDAAMQLARSYAVGNPKNGGNVLNMMQVGGAQQVMLEVQVAEVSRNFLKRIGTKFQSIGTDGYLTFGGTNGGTTLRPMQDNPLYNSPTTFPPHAVTGGGQAIPNNAGAYPSQTTEVYPNPISAATTGLFASYMDGSTLFDLVIDAATENGLAKVLAEPTLTTLTGQEATFHAGGEFPIPIAGGANEGTTISFKEFGIALGFVPTVLDSGTISLKLNIEVSELSNENAVAVSVPDTGNAFLVNSLTSRSASSTVELGNGQTMGIAGLINENLREQINKFPGLGDIPILGHLFRSQEYVKGKSELVILVTPHFAKPVDRKELSLPTDAFVDPSSMDFYLLGRMEGKAKDDQQTTKSMQQGSVDGQFGHEL